MSFVYVFVGGGLGSICRYGLARLAPAAGYFPLGTWLANAVSCVVLGALVALAAKETLAEEYRWLLVTGFCGGFSTFSTFSNELVQLLRQEQYIWAGGYLVASLAVGLLGIIVGMRIIGG
ncbi:MAG: fluoride efflux transporter CrcB [Lewinella sp.]|nr:fluoride efflux transporter CrcB [Lewinella sp.]